MALNLPDRPAVFCQPEHLISFFPLKQQPSFLLMTSLHIK